MPENEKIKRKLSAILSADVKGYSVLMADDEVHTCNALLVHVIDGIGAAASYTNDLDGGA